MEKTKSFNSIFVNLTTKLSKILLVNLYAFLFNAIFAAAVYYNVIFTNLFTMIAPVFFILLSVAVYFKAMKNIYSNNSLDVSIKQYFRYYVQLFSSFWKIYVLILVTIIFALVDLRILYIKHSNIVHLIPLIITVAFLINSFLFMIYITTDHRAKELKLSTLVMQCLLLSYKLLGVTIINISIILLSFFLMLYYPVLYLVIFAGVFNFLIFFNIKRKFDLDLFFMN